MQRLNKAVYLTRAAGYTLIELLIVLSIISLLAAIIFPVFSRVRERGRSTVCMSNLKQIALAMQQYVADNDGHYPLELDTNGKRWSHKIFPYIKDFEVFRCPTLSKPLEPRVDPLGSRLVYKYNSLRLTRFVFSPVPGGAGNSEARETLSAHASTIFLVSCDPLPMYESDPPYETLPTSCGRMTTVGYDVRHHSGGTNWSFLDGHVKWLTPEQLAELSCANPLRTDLPATP